jgi:hypothetical protein
LALDKAGNSIAARMAMIAMTTSNSINVKADLRFFSGPALNRYQQEVLGRVKITRAFAVWANDYSHTPRNPSTEFPVRENPPTTCGPALR